MTALRDAAALPLALMVMLLCCRVWLLSKVVGESAARIMGQGR
jgi:hypothetical protein